MKALKKQQYIEPAIEMIEVEKTMLQANTWTDPDGSTIRIISDKNPDQVIDDDDDDNNYHAKSFNAWKTWEDVD